MRAIFRRVQRAYFRHDRRTGGERRTDVTVRITVRSRRRSHAAAATRRATQGEGGLRFLGGENVCFSVWGTKRTLILCADSLGVWVPAGMVRHSQKVGNSRFFVLRDTNWW